MFQWRFTFIFLCLCTIIFAQEVDDHQHGQYNFLENKGQWPDHVNYCADMDGGKIWLEKGRVLYQFSDYSDLHKAHAKPDQEFKKPPQFKEALVYAEFLNANQNATTSHENPTSEYYNYFLGNDPDKWARGVRGYNSIKYKNLYPGIDLSFYEKELELKYDFNIAPKADPNLIKIKYHGADKIKLTSKGHVIVETEIGQLQEQKPYAYQIVNGKIVEVPCDFHLKDDVVSFTLGDYNKNAELIIDPILVFATYCGSPTDNFGMTATYAYTGEAYSGGTIYGNAYPVPAPVWNNLSNFTGVSSANYGITDVFVSKYNEDGTQMIWTNFIGGGDNTQGTETVHSLICDTLDNIYMYGATSSTDFPLKNAFQNAHAGGASGANFYQNGVYYSNQGTDIYVTKISADGMNLIGSTYIGGSGNDGINYNLSSYAFNYNGLQYYDSLTANYGDQFRGEIMLDSVNNIIIASSTWSQDFPLVNPIQNNNAGLQDAVLFKIQEDFSSLISSTYIGGSNNDAGYSVKVDSSGNILMAGGTSSSDLIGTNDYQNTYGGGDVDGYVFKFPPDMSTIDYGTYVGTNSYDQVYFVDIDRADNIYILGQSEGGMPISSGVYSNPGSGHFVWRLDPQLSSITKSTVFGNGTQDMISPSAFMIDVCGNIYISGWGGNILSGAAALTGMPVTGDAYQGSSGDGYNFYLMVLEREMNSLLYGSYLGSTSSAEHVDGGTSRFDKYGVVYQSVCGGCGGDDFFPTTPGAWSSDNLSSNCNNVIFKFDFEIVPKAEFSVDQFEGCAPLTITFVNNSGGTDDYLWDFGNGDQTTVENPVRTFPTPGTYEVTLYVTDSVCNLTDTAKKIVTVHPELILETNNDTLLCSPNAFDLTADSYGTANTFTWSDDPNFTNVLNPGGDSVITINPTQPTYFYVEVSNPFCTLKDSVFVDFIGSAITVTNDTSICEGDTLTLEVVNQNPQVTLTYNWFPTTIILGNNNSSTVEVLPTNSGYVYVQAQTSNGCTILDSVYIDLINLPQSSVFATAEPDTIAEGGSTDLTAFPENADHYLWVPTVDISDPNASSITVSPENDMTYTVFVTKDGCERLATVKVYVAEFACEPPYIYVPNAFTPNYDGRNDIVYVRGLNLETLEFAIYDRWGEKIFYTTDQSEGWDGTFKGKPMDPDVYMYYLSGTCVGGDEFILKGDITLIR